MDPEHVISKMELQDPTVSPYIICCILGCCIALFYIYSYDTGLFYDTNIQYTQLLHWAIRQTQFYYSISLILVHSTIPMLSNLISFYWAALIEQDFIISPLFSMALSFIFGSLYWTNVLWSTIIKLGRSIEPVLFIYTNYILVHSTDPYFYILSIFLGWSIIPTLFLVSSSNPIFTLISLILGLLYKPILFLLLVSSIRPTLLYWTTLVYQSIKFLGY